MSPKYHSSVIQMCYSTIGERHNNGLRSFESSHRAGVNLDPKSVTVTLVMYAHAAARDAAPMRGRYSIRVSKRTWESNWIDGLGSAMSPTTCMTSRLFPRKAPVAVSSAPAALGGQVRSFQQPQALWMDGQARPPRLLYYQICGIIRHPVTTAFSRDAIMMPSVFRFTRHSPFVVILPWSSNTHEDNQNRATAMVLRRPCSWRSRASQSVCCKPRFQYSSSSSSSFHSSSSFSPPSSSSSSS